MAPANDTESQFKFLISCIKHSQGGKVNFGNVANECDIVSKGAAAKRYERLMKQHGISPSGVSVAGVKKEGKEGKEPKKEPTKARKKRKLAEVEDDVGDVDEPIKGEVKNEDAAPVKTEPVKAEAGADVKSEKVKAEHGIGVFEAVAGTESSTAIPGTETGDSRNMDDDDEVFVVSATRRSDTSTSMPSSNGSHFHQHGHSDPLSHSHAHTPMLMATATPGVHSSFDYSANLGFATQATPLTPMPTMVTPTTPRAPSSSPSAAFPYGFGAGPWFNPYDPTVSSPIYGHGHGHFWQSMSTPEPQHHHHNQGENQDKTVEGATHQ